MQDEEKEWAKSMKILADCAERPEAEFKYKENDIVKDFLAYLRQTYGEHYKSDDGKIECFDAWISLGDATPTFRNTAIKYLWRYGKKKHCNKNDLFKAMHYVLMCLYADFYKEKG